MRTEVGNPNQLLRTECKYVVRFFYQARFLSDERPNFVENLNIHYITGDICVT